MQTASTTPKFNLNLQASPDQYRKQLVKKIKNMVIEPIPSDIPILDHQAILQVDGGQPASLQGNEPTLQ